MFDYCRKTMQFDKNSGLDKNKCYNRNKDGLYLGKFLGTGVRCGENMNPMFILNYFENGEDNGDGRKFNNKSGLFPKSSDYTIVTCQGGGRRKTRRYKNRRSRTRSHRR